MQIMNPFKFLFGMRVWVRRMRSVRIILQRFPCPVKALIPAHQRSFRDMAAATDKLDADAGAVKLDGMESGRNFMWQITILWLGNAVGFQQQIYGG